MKKAFTLIELLVVIAIIAILAAILFPVFAQAKLAAKKSSDLSNTKQQGVAVQIYLNDYDDTYPQAYYYPDDNSSAGGYAHWSGVLQPYIKNLQIFVSPGDPLGGMAPTNYSTATNNRGYGVPGGQTPQTNADIDNQAPRISYVGNEALLPRKRRTADPAHVTSATAIDNVSTTILIAPLTSDPGCINGASSASGTAFKSHRPANAWYAPADGQPEYDGELAADVNATQIWAITVAQAITTLQNCGTSAGSSHDLRIAYVAPYRFGGSKQKPNDGGGNYVFADTSAKYQPLSATIRPDRFLWGTKNYTGGGQSILDQVSGNPVQ